MGLFGIAEDYSESYQSLDERFVKNQSSTFFFQMTSQAMAPFILEKDILIIDRELEVLTNRIILCALDSEFLCRRFFQSGPGGNNERFLLADNKTYKPILLSTDNPIEFFGVVRGIARDVL